MIYSKFINNYDVTNQVFRLLPGALQDVDVELLDVPLAVGLGGERVIAHLALVRPHSGVGAVVPVWLMSKFNYKNQFCLCYLCEA